MLETLFALNNVSKKITTGLIAIAEGAKQLDAAVEGKAEK